MTDKVFTYWETCQIFDNSEGPFKFSVTVPFELHEDFQWYVDYLGQEYEIRLVNVQKTTLREVAEKHYRTEGFESTEKFLDNWLSKLEWVNDQAPKVDLDQVVWRGEIRRWKHN